MTFVTRAGCHLCAEAEPLVVATAERMGIPVEVVDIDDDDDLIRRFALRIPVVLGPTGAVVAEGIIEKRSLRRQLRRARRAASRP